MSNSCRECHFLAKTHVDRMGKSDTHSWNTEERANLQIRDDYVAECKKGIWSRRINPRLNLANIFSESRGDTCFFVKYGEGMSFDGATELHRLKNDNRQLKKSYRYTQLGLAIAAGSLFLSLLLEVVKFYFTG